MPARPSRPSEGRPRRPGGGRGARQGPAERATGGTAPKAPSAARAPATQGPPRPDLPHDEQPLLPRAVVREIERTLGKGQRARDVALALSIASEAIEIDELGTAVGLLAWATHEAPRVAAVREAHGVALYRSERFSEALTALQAYRRLSGRNDQNHLIADCLRAGDRGLDQVVGVAAELAGDVMAEAERRAEAILVVAGARADSGEVRQARSLIESCLAGPSGTIGLPGHEPIVGFDLPAETRARVLWLTADLAVRDGDEGRARTALDELIALDGDFPEARELRASLNPSG